MGVDAQMFVRVPREMSDDEIKSLSYRFGSMCNEHLFLLGYQDKLLHKPLERIKKYVQDGPVITPKHGETFLNVPLSGRYYGEGYERGSLLAYIGIAEFLECLIPDGAIWYGGDSSGINAEPFDRARRKELLKYAAGVAHDPYTKHEVWMSRNDGFQSQTCPHCDVTMHRDGYGANYALYRCDGCGWEIQFRDGKKVEGLNLFDRERRGNKEVTA